MTYHQTTSELNKHFKESLCFLRESARSFDRGDVAHAKRLALEIRKLVHDTISSHSLLKQLNLKDGSFPDTSRDLPKPSLRTITPGYFGLIEMSPGGYRAPLHAAPLKTTEFNSWWNAVIFQSQDGETLTRKELILYVANRDGGAHVDPELDEKYARLSRSNHLGHFVANCAATLPTVGQRLRVDELRPLEHACLVAVRQVAHELLTRFMPRYFTWDRPDSRGPTIGEMSVGLA